MSELESCTVPAGLFGLDDDYTTDSIDSRLYGSPVHAFSDWPDDEATALRHWYGSLATRDDAAPDELF